MAMTPLVHLYARQSSPGTDRRRRPLAAGAVILAAAFLALWPAVSAEAVSLDLIRTGTFATVRGNVDAGRSESFTGVAGGNDINARVNSFGHFNAIAGAPLGEGAFMGATQLVFGINAVEVVHQFSDIVSLDLSASTRFDFRAENTGDLANVVYNFFLFKGGVLEVSHPVFDPVEATLEASVAFLMFGPSGGLVALTDVWKWKAVLTATSGGLNADATAFLPITFTIDDTGEFVDLLGIGKPTFTTSQPDPFSVRVDFDRFEGSLNLSDAVAIPGAVPLGPGQFVDLFTGLDASVRGGGASLATASLGDPIALDATSPGVGMQVSLDGLQFSGPGAAVPAPPTVVLLSVGLAAALAARLRRRVR